MVRVALYQSRTGIDPKASARELACIVEQAANEGAAMLFTPEMSGVLDGNRDRSAKSVVSEADDQVLESVCEAARRTGVWVHLGSLALRVDDSGRFVNRGFVIDANGEIRGRYDKIHLFDVDLPTGESWRESASYRGGDKAVVVRGTPVGDLGLAICYDLRFPALFERLSEAGAQTIRAAVDLAFGRGQVRSWDIGGNDGTGTVAEAVAEIIRSGEVDPA